MLGRVVAMVAVLVLPPVAAAAGEAEAVAPGRVTPLFNGRDLTGLRPWLKRSGHQDPKKVFTAHDGMIHVSGEDDGYLATEKEYRDYYLVVEYKWGEKTWPPREDKARDSGVLLHCVGEEGAAGGVWMESIECQLIEGGTGDIILVKGKNSPAVTATAIEKDTGDPDKPHKEFYFQPGAPPHSFTSGRINWFDRDPQWRDIKDFRGRKDVENKPGEWNALEITCDGDSLTFKLNGVTVNAATKSSHTKGKILFQSEGAEIFFRKIDLTSIKK
jgi:hypothetical protein